MRAQAKHGRAAKRSEVEYRAGGTGVEGGGGKRHKGPQGRSTGHAFSAENPYGKRSDGDSRQFSRV